ncbi:MAG: tyrosine--tRNA ligase [Desulfovibrio sp.]|jgi:tyrosyl-tRNA synthetase
MNIYDELKWRGLVNQVSDEEGVREYLSEPGRSMYCGFDPTAESLHIGNLVPLLSLVRMKRAGHNPIFLLGGATGRIGDPSGKDKERDMATEEVLDNRASMIESQVRSFVERNSEGTADIRNNYEWTKEMSALELLRDVGRHFTVNWMMQKDSIKNRFNRDSVGISYTEFSYMVLQGMDYWKLYKEYGCRLQIGGSDQWGNITAGCELIRRKEQDTGYALTFPLITTASGKKFGKSEGNAIWMNPDMVSPYAFYQFWLNTEDADVVNFLGYFTFLDQDEINNVAESVANEPHLRLGQKRLAEEVTRMVHGQNELDKVQIATDVLFGSGDIAKVDPATLKQALDAAPAITRDKAALPDLPQMLVDLGLAKSKGQARKDIQGGGVYVNQERVDADFQPSARHFLGGELLVLRKGKKNYGLVTVE